MASASSLNAMLITELQALASEAKRRSPEVRTAAEEAVAALKAANKASPAGGAPLSPSTSASVLRALVAASRSSSTQRYLSQVVMLLHRLVSHGALLLAGDTSPSSSSDAHGDSSAGDASGEAQMDDVLLIIEQTTDGGDDVQLKGLQCVMPLLTQYPATHGAPLFRAYAACMRLQQAKSPTVANAGVAITRQLVIWLFEHVRTEASQSAVINDHSELQPYAADAYMVVQDLCSLAAHATGHSEGSEPLAGLPVTFVAAPFALELLEAVLVQNSDVFRGNASFGALLRERLCPLVAGRLRSPLQDSTDAFSVTCRLWRLLVVLATEYYDVLDDACHSAQWALVCASLESLAASPSGAGGRASWQHGLALEALRDILSTQGALSHAVAAAETGAHRPSVYDAAAGVSNALVGCLIMLGASQTAESGPLEYARQLPRLPLMQQSDRGVSGGSTHGIVVASVGYMLLLAYDCVVRLVAYSAAREDSSGATVFGNVESTEALHADRAEEKEGVKTYPLLMATWKGSRSALCSLLSDGALGAEWRDMALQTLAGLARLLSRSSCAAGLDAVLNGMCQAALPDVDAGAGTIAVTDLNVAACAAVLSLALRPTDDFDVGACWIHVVRVMHAVDLSSALRVVRGRTSQQSSDAARRSPGPDSYDGADMRSLSTQCEALVARSADLPDSGFEAMLRAWLVLAGEAIAAGAGASAVAAVLARSASNEAALGSSRTPGGTSSAMRSAGSLHSLETASARIPDAVRGMETTATARATLPLEKICTLALLNIARFTAPSPAAWGLLMGHLEIAVCAADAAVRALACDTASQLCESLPHASGADEAFHQSSVLQERSLEPLRRVLRASSANQYRDVATDQLPGVTEAAGQVRRAVLDTLLRYLERYGPLVNTGWPSVFAILSDAVSFVPSSDNASALPDAASLPENSTNDELRRSPLLQAKTAALGRFSPQPETARAAFACARLICAELLPGLAADALKAVVALLSGPFAHAHVDLNMALASVGLLWDVADHVRQRVDAEVHVQSGAFDLWVEVLGALASLATDIRPDVRNSAVQTAVRAISICAACDTPCGLTAVRWDGVFERVLLVIVANVERASESLVSLSASSPAVTKSSPAKQWAATRILVTESVADIVTRFAPALVAQSNLPVYWDALVLAAGRLCTPPAGDFASVEALEISARLTATGVSALHCMLSSLLAACASNETSLLALCLSHCAWQSWVAMAASMDGDSQALFGQDTLVEYVRMLNTFVSVRRTRRPPDGFDYPSRTVDDEQSMPGHMFTVAWLAESWGAVDCALRHAPPRWLLESREGVLLLASDAAAARPPVSPVDSAFAGRGMLTALQAAAIQCVISSADLDGTDQAARPALLRTLAGWMTLLQATDTLGVQVQSPTSDRSSRGFTSASPASPLHAPPPTVQLPAMAAPALPPPGLLSSEHSSGNHTPSANALPSHGRTPSAGSVRSTSPSHASSRAQAHPSFSDTHYVGVAVAAMDLVAQRLGPGGRWSRCGACLCTGTIEAVLRALGRLMVLKYRLPAVPGDSLWRLATRVFNTVCVSVLDRLPSSATDDGVLSELSLATDRLTVAGRSRDSLVADRSPDSLFVADLFGSTDSEHGSGDDRDFSPPSPLPSKAGSASVSVLTTEHRHSVDESVRRTWEALADVLTDALEASRVQVPREVPAEQFAADEAFDSEEVRFIARCILPTMGAQRDDHAVSMAVRVLRSLADNAHLYYGKRAARVSRVAGDEQSSLASRSVLELSTARSAAGISLAPSVLPMPTVASLTEVVPVAREAYATACADVLYELCCEPAALPSLRHWGGARVTPVATAASSLPLEFDDEEAAAAALLSDAVDGVDGHPMMPRRVRLALRDGGASFREPVARSVALAAAALVLGRSRRVLERYVADKAILGRMPLPRVRQAEVLHALRHLVALRVPRGLVMDMGVLGSGGISESPHIRSVEALRASLGERHCADAVAFLSPYAPPVGGLPSNPRRASAKDDADAHRTALLSTSIGHLFALYGALHAALSIDDAPVVRLVHAAFAQMGEHLGLLAL